MVNTIWKEGFLIMCSKFWLNARNPGRFAQLLHICRNYTLQTLCGAPHNVANDEGKLLGMEGNRRLSSGSVIAGPFFIIGDAGEKFRSLTDAEVNRYLQVYAEPQQISQRKVQADMGMTFYCF